LILVTVFVQHPN